MHYKVGKPWVTVVGEKEGVVLGRGEDERVGKREWVHEIPLVVNKAEGGVMSDDGRYEDPGMWGGEVASPECDLGFAAIHALPGRGVFGPEVEMTMRLD